MAEFRNPVQNGKEIKDEVSILVGNQVFEGWESVSLTKNLESIANSFSVQLFDKFEGLKSSWPLKPGVEVKAIINQERVLTGFIEALAPGFSSNSRSFSISGRSKAGDLVDCSHTGPMEYTNINLEQLATELAKPFGITVLKSVDSKVIKKFSVKPGETIFEALDRAARLQGFFFISTRNGNIRLTKAAANEARFRATDNLEQDVNLIAGNAVYDDSKRHSEYKIVGQTSGSPNLFGAGASGPSGTAKDLGVKRHRPVELIAESNADSGQCQKRAEWEASVRLGQATRIEANVQGWTQTDGKLWGVNQLTRIKSRFLGINARMLITAVNHTQSTDQGKQTKLTLVDPQAYNAQPIVNATDSDNIFSNLGADF